MTYLRPETAVTSTHGPIQTKPFCTLLHFVAFSGFCPTLPLKTLSRLHLQRLRGQPEVKEYDLAAQYHGMGAVQSAHHGKWGIRSQAAHLDVARTGFRPLAHGGIDE